MSTSQEVFSPPEAVKHNDNRHSDMPQRDDKQRQQAPHDKLNHSLEEREPPVG